MLLAKQRLPSSLFARHSGIFDEPRLQEEQRFPCRLVLPPSRQQAAGGSVSWLPWHAEGFENDVDLSASPTVEQMLGSGIG
jgi:hypothetical protein